MNTFAPTSSNSLTPPTETMSSTEIAKLTGTELDYWVAMAGGKDAYFENDRCFTAFIDGNIKYYYVYSPSTNPAQGWPIIERLKINLNWVDGNQWEAVVDKYKVNNWVLKGETSLIAAMRCYVASVYGETVGDDE